MATARVMSNSGGHSEIRTDFSTKEGYYRNVLASQHCRPSRQPLFGKELSPVQVSFVSCKDKEGLIEWILFNSGKELYFYQFDGVGKVPDLKRPIDKRVYRSPTVPVCHDFNLMTRSKAHLDLIVGFSTGPLQYLNPIERHAICAFNEDGSIDSSRVTSVKWVPGSETTFISTHMSGNLYLWTTEHRGKGAIPQTYVLQSEITDAKVYTAKPKNKSSILYRWSVGHGAITSASFSPNAIHIAICSQDGFLRIYDFHKQVFYGRMRSYFGALLCVCWSPDGKYVATGGEDDLVTVWSFEHKRVLARGEGHKSYVSAVAFDPYTTVLPDSSDETREPFSDTHSSGSPTLQSHSRISLSSNRSSWYEPGLNAELDMTAYRLGSIGQDTQLCLWDLSGDVLRLRRFARTKSRLSRHASKPASSGDPTTSVATTTDERGSLTSEVVQASSSSKRNSSIEDKDVESRSVRSSKGTSPIPNHCDAGTSRQNSTASPELPQDKLTAPDSNKRDLSPSPSVSSTEKDKNKKKQKKKKEDKTDSKKSTPSPEVPQDATDKLTPPPVADGAGREKRDTSPSSSSVNSEKEKNKKKQKKNKEDKSEPKKVRLVSRGSLHNVRKVIKFVSSGISSQGHSYHNFNRRAVGNFEPCNSDDIAPKMHEVNLIEPLVNKKISQERLTALVFREDCIVTANQEGFISTWARPDSLKTHEDEEEEVEEQSVEHQPSTEAGSNPGINSPKPGATGSDPGTTAVKTTTI